MSLWKIAWRSVQQRSLSSLLTGLSMALGVALVIMVLVVYGAVEQQFRQGGEGYHLIVGAKGGKLQLVLNTVYHLSQPIENIPYSYYKEFTEGKFAAFTEVVVPCCMGDSYLSGGQTYRVLGTTTDMFDRLVYGKNSDGSPRQYTFQAGRNFKSANFFEAVIGSVVAAKTGLGVGDSFQPAHGIVEEGDEAHEHQAFKIVGVLGPTGTPNDRAMFVNMEGFFLLEGHAKEAPPEESPAEKKDHDHDDHDHQAHDHPASDGTAEAHDHEGHDHPPAADKHDDHAHHAHAHHDHDHDHGHAHQPLPESQREVTALLVLLKNNLFSQGLFTRINEGQVAQAVFPVTEVETLLTKFVGPIQTVLLALTLLIIVVAGIGIMVSIYNSMSERAHEIAVMRALGAGRVTVLAVVLLESIIISLAGGLAGVVIGHGAIGLMSPYVLAETGVLLHVLSFQQQELVLVPGLVLLATFAGFLPALAAYRTDVARALIARP